MVSKINSFAFSGIEAVTVNVECQIAPGLPNFIVVGLPDKAVAESRERVRAAFTSIGLAFPAKRVIINLAPADLYKEGSHFDLPIALAILGVMKIVPDEEIEKYFALGEISLDGRILPVSGVLPAAVTASAENKAIICPKENAREALWASSELDIIAPISLIDLINHLNNRVIIPRAKLEDITQEITPENYPDFADVKGQEQAKRAAEITAAGGHNLLMSGPPGSGKSMIASRLASILPDLTPKEILETSMIYSVAGYLKGNGLVSIRPFRSPHHNASMPALIGGGKNAKPGEISLSHNGVLFLDELPEFTRQVLDSLRQPLENRSVTISRVNSHVTYPAKFQLIAAMNPCKCGYISDPSRACNQVPRCAVAYQNKLSGPLLDRIDIHIEVPAQNPLKAFNETTTESSAVIKNRVLKAREIQRKRYMGKDFTTNSEIVGEDLDRFCVVTDDAKKMLEQGVEKLKLSMRGYAKTLRVARTIADLENSEIIEKKHIAESLSYRQINYTR
ncbi:MAG TPA: AAA family ATPase [Alphaproteobacteria bacterium]|nr:AAA family ATPase [Alphaproteobacteria bacterium]